MFRWGLRLFAPQARPKVFGENGCLFLLENILDGPFIPQIFEILLVRCHLGLDSLLLRPNV
jgi:hypothetical protein